MNDVSEDAGDPRNWEHAELRVRRPASAMIVVSQMEKDDTVYVVTYQGPKIKRTVTGKYSGHADGTLLLEDKNGRFNKVPIESIIRINYYIEGRAPF